MAMFACDSQQLHRIGVLAGFGRAAFTHSHTYYCTVMYIVIGMCIVWHCLYFTRVSHIRPSSRGPVEGKSSVCAMSMIYIGKLF